MARWVLVVTLLLSLSGFLDASPRRFRDSKPTVQAPVAPKTRGFQPQSFFHPVINIVSSSYDLPETDPFFIRHPVTVTDEDAPALCQEIVNLTITQGGGKIEFWPGFDDPRNGFPFPSTSVYHDGGLTASLKGNLAQINWALSNLKYTPEKYYFGSAYLQIVVNQLGCGGGPSNDVTSGIAFNIISTNDAPNINLRGYAPNKAPRLNSVEDTPISLSFDLWDVDAGTSGMLLNFTASNGELTLSEVRYDLFTFFTITPSFIALTGNQLDMNRALLQNVTFTPYPHYHGLAGVTVSVNDMGGHGTGGALGDTVTVILDLAESWDAMQLTLGFEGCAEDAVDVPVLIYLFDRDLDADMRMVSYATAIITVTNGTLSFAQSAAAVTYDAAAGSYTLFGTFNMILRATNGTLFTPDPDFNGNAILTVQFMDYPESAHIQGSPVRNVTKTMQLAVSAVNDAPRMYGAQRTWHVRQNEYLIVTELEAYDVDANPLTDLIDVVINSTHGKLTLGWRPYWLSGPAYVPQNELPGGTHKEVTEGFAFTTTMDGLNKILGSIHDDHRGLGYQNDKPLPAAIHYIDTPVHDVDYITITISDRGSSGAGGVQSATFSIMVTSYVDQYPTCKTFLDLHPQYCGCYYISDHANSSVTDWTTLPTDFSSTLYLKETAPARFSQGCCDLYHYPDHVSGSVFTRVDDMGLCSPLS